MKANLYVSGLAWW